MILDTFFEISFLKRQLSERTKELGDKEYVKTVVQDVLASDGFDELLEKKLANLQQGSGIAGTVMKTFNIQGSAIKPTFKKVMRSMAPDLTSAFLESFDPVAFFDETAVRRVRTQIEEIIEDRMRELTAERVKELMEIVIRVHLGWLVVWGNVFGGVIGVVSTALGY
eukprot:c36094_g1_i1.p1 GENE.c36094_g1_i1~~c36094_g1_i1.p1  ORF type:complete len:167 (-),score=56.93 c36094_g1_i1:74-574(-)